MTAARRLVFAALALAVALGLAACGSKDNIDKNAAAAAAISQSFLSSTNPPYGLTSTQTSCLGTGIIKDFGVEKAIAYKFLAAGNKPVSSVSIMLSTQDAATFSDTFIACTDATNLLKSSLVAKINPKTAAARQQLENCLNQNLTNALMRANLTQAFSGAQQTALNPVVATCSKFG